MCRGSRANATDGMNPASNTPGPQQHGDPGWVVAHEQQWHEQGVNAVNTGHFQAAGRPEWDWVENPMLLHVHNTSTNIHPSAATGAAQEVDAEHKLHSLPRPGLGLPPPPSSSVVCSNMNRSYTLANYSPGAPPPPHNAFSSSSHQHQHHMHNSLSSLSLRSYPGPGHMDHQVYHQLYGAGSGAEVNMNAELRSYEQRRRYLGLLESHEQQQSRVNVLELVKREEMFCPVEPQARIGLNLGGRTYFSAEDSAARVLGKRSRINALGTHAHMCQVQGCSADLTKAKHYHRRHKVCEIHSKAPNVIASGHTQRFCQQCSRFHQLSEFDDTKRSCRKRLADHNRRRRKPQHSAIAGISTVQPFKTEEQQSTGSAINVMRPTPIEEHKPGAMVQLHVEKSASPTASVMDRDSMMSCGGANNRLQVQSPSYGTILDDKQSGRNALVRAQAMPSSDVQALVLSVVSRPPTPGPHSTRQSPGTQESVYHQYLHGGPSLSLSSAGMNAPPPHTQHNNNSSPSSQNYSSIEHSSSLPWLPSCSRSRSTSSHLVPLQQPRAPSALQTYSNPARSRILATQVGHDHHDSQVHQPEQHHQYMVHTGSTGDGEQLGRLGLRQGTAMDGHRMLALIENPAHQQQLTSSVDDVKPLQHHHGHHSEMQSSTGVRSSFGSSFYDSSSSIG